MTDTAEVKEQEIVEPVNPFSNNAWKETPTVVAETPPIQDPVIKEKDEQIKEGKPTSDKPAEPEKIPGATPDPIQDRPLNDDPATKKEEPLKFLNTESEKIYNLIKEGKTDDVYAILAEQKKLESAEGADAIKLQLQYQNKDFSPDDINDLFNERYTMPDQPIQTDLESDDEYNDRVEKYNKEVKKIEGRIARDAKPAKTELQKLKQEIVLPDIAREQPLQAEPTQEELDGLQKAKEMFFKTVDESAKTFNGYKTTFKDGEVQIEAAYNVTEEQKKTVNPLIESAYTDLPKFFNELGWISEDGKVNPKMIEDLHLIQNKDTVFSKLVSEVGNKRHEAAIKSIKNIDYSGKAKSNGDLGVTPQEQQASMVNHFFSQ